MKLLFVISCLISAIATFVAFASIAVMPAFAVDDLGSRLIFGAVFGTGHLYSAITASGALTGRIQVDI
jgi:hypothetical protein